VTREEVIALAHLGTKDGVLKETESKIINNLINLHTLKVRDIMTPRTVVVSAPEDLEQLAKKRSNQKLKDLKRPLTIFFEHASVHKLFEELILKR